MIEKNGKKLIIVIASVMLAAALGAGVLVGKMFGIVNSGPLYGTAATENIEIFLQTDVRQLLKAWDNYLLADVQQAEMSIVLDSNIIRFDEEFTVQTGMYKSDCITYIRVNKLDAYICNGKVYVEESASFDTSIDIPAESGVDVTGIYNFIYEICTESEFEITEEDGKKIYRLSLTEGQLEEIISEAMSQADIDVDITNGSLEMVVEGKNLIQLDIFCQGKTHILGFDMPLELSVKADTTALADTQIYIPQSVQEKIEANK